jgi:protease YdgD
MIRGQRLLTHDCSATRGTSGGPLLARCCDYWEAVGINIAVTPSANIALPVTAIPGAR